jgi:hypothetical protein
LAQRGEKVARSVADPLARLISDSLLGISHHLVGSQASAQACCQAALGQPQLNWYGSSLGRVGYDHRIRTQVALMRTLWLQGYADQAVGLAGQTVQEAEELGHPVSIGFALLYSATVFMWVGRTSFASELIDRVLAHTERHCLVPYHAVGLGLKAKLALQGGDANGAGELLRTCLENLYFERHRILLAVFLTDIVTALMMSGRLVEALAAVDEGLAGKHTFRTPELWRLKGEILAAQSPASLPKVEKCLQHSLEIARQQGALAWELRAATDLARLWRDSRRHQEGRELLAGVYGRFTEGFETPDLATAQRVLLELTAQQTH